MPWKPINVLSHAKHVMDFKEDLISRMFFHKICNIFKLRLLLCWIWFVTSVLNCCFQFFNTDSAPGTLSTICSSCDGARVSTTVTITQVKCCIAIIHVLLFLTFVVSTVTLLIKREDLCITSSLNTNSI